MLKSYIMIGKTEKLVFYMQNSFTAVFEKIDDWYIGYVQELPGANVQERTLEEARESLREAIKLILVSNLAA
jgi:predicted RNase H-like HicB family nuclease